MRFDKTRLLPNRHYFRGGGLEILTLEAEVGEKGQILNALLILGELRKHQETPPALPLTWANAFPADSQIVEIGFRYDAPTHNPGSADAFKNKIDKR